MNHLCGRFKGRQQLIKSIVSGNVENMVILYTTGFALINAGGNVYSMWLRMHGREVGHHIYLKKT